MSDNVEGLSHTGAAQGIGKAIAYKLAQARSC
ncbi:hypothetical protein SMWOGL2_31360 [Sporomusa malonica]